MNINITPIIILPLENIYYKPYTNFLFRKKINLTLKMHSVALNELNSEL